MQARDTGAKGEQVGRGLTLVQVAPADTPAILPALTILPFPGLGSGQVHSGPQLLCWLAAWQPWNCVRGGQGLWVYSQFFPRHLSQTKDLQDRESGQQVQSSSLPAYIDGVHVHCDESAVSRAWASGAIKVTLHVFCYSLKMRECSEMGFSSATFRRVKNYQGSHEAGEGRDTPQTVNENSLNCRHSQNL